jgi:lipoprotein-anchoring transpeptidase ErfK/SrfK
MADKYIEVDISQQKMYLFHRGVLQKTYRVSTGLEYPTPTGEFTILNKVGLGFSNIYDVWMPWWMGFKYSDELHAYFGIHELPYKEINGTKIARSNAALGAPSTGGCVALGVGDAQEVYRFADIGTRLVIYN